MPNIIIGKDGAYQNGFFSPGGVPSANLLSYFPLDSNGNDQEGTLTLQNNSGVTFVNDPTRGSVAEFQRSNDDYLDYGSNTIFDNAQKLSISVWVNAASIQGGTGAQGHGASALPENSIFAMAKAGQDDKVGLALNDTDGVAFYVDWGTSGAGTATLQVSNVISLSTWHHIAAVFDGSLANDQWKVYVDGTLEGTKTDASANNVITQNIATRIGGNATTGNQAFDGKMDDLRLYTGALTQSEVTSLANS
jgi:hypothetical protein